MTALKLRRKGTADDAHVVKARATDADRPSGDANRPRLALALAGGAARGLAHIGVLEVFEREGIPVHAIAGASMGGLVGALSAGGLSATQIAEIARGFRFPQWFLPGGLVEWDRIFRTAVPALSKISFEQLATPLAVTAVDLEAGSQIVLHTGPLLPAVRATCAVPGVLPAVRLGGRWLIDGGLVNVLPVDIAWMTDPDVVVAVKAGTTRPRRIPQLGWRITTWLSRLGLAFPNPATAKVSLEVLMRAVEIALDRQLALAAAMTDPELIIEPELGDMTLRDFDRLDEAVAAGRRAAEATLPDIIRLLQSPASPVPRSERVLSLRFDPVCAMVISPARARATITHEGKTYYFCSPNCCDAFAQAADYYANATPLAFSPPRRTSPKETSKQTP